MNKRLDGQTIWWRVMSLLIFVSFHFCPICGLFAMCNQWVSWWYATKSLSAMGFLKNPGPNLRTINHNLKHNKALTETNFQKNKGRFWSSWHHPQKSPKGCWSFRQVVILTIKGFGAWCLVPWCNRLNDNLINLFNFFMKGTFLPLTCSLSVR